MSHFSRHLAVKVSETMHLRKHWLTEVRLVIEIKVQDSSVNAVQFEEAMNKVFDSLKLPRGFLGVFYGPQHENPGTFILVTKWEGSKGVVNNDSWLRESEESLQSMFGGKARIQSRRQMYS